MMFTYIHKSETCNECKASPSTTDWGDGLKRCADCTSARSEKYRQEREARRKELLVRKCEQCNEPIGHDIECSDYCRECCEHEYDAGEGFMCLNCGDYR